MSRTPYVCGGSGAFKSAAAHDHQPESDPGQFQIGKYPLKCFNNGRGPPRRADTGEPRGQARGMLVEVDTVLEVGALVLLLLFAAKS
jgi:hypothetical protein